MSIPSTETSPDEVHLARKPQGWRIRQMIKDGGARELRSYAEKMMQRSRVNSAYFAQLAPGLALLLVGILVNNPLLVIIAGVSSPVLNPIVGLVSAAIRPSTRHLLKSIFYLALTILLFFAVGWLVNLLSPELGGALEILRLFSGGDGWFSWVILVVFSIIGLVLFIFQDNIPSVLVSTVLFFLIFIPISAAGYQMARGDTALRASLLIISSSRLFTSLSIMLLTAWVAGFQPRRVVGWITIGLVFIAALLLLNEAFGFFPAPEQPDSMPGASIVALLTPGVPTEEPTIAPGFTATSLPTATPRPTATLSPTASPSLAPAQSEPEEPAAPEFLQAEVTAESGIVVREAPDVSSLILAYFNKGQIVTLFGEQVTEQNIVWEKVLLEDGTVGWATSRYLLIISD
ncbi:MAG: SH3 domain-containing protein [Chloroflexi bacterium]|nr:SH3 domain-containing protein [Chloroflexota bacterium]